MAPLHSSITGWKNEMARIRSQLLLIALFAVPALADGKFYVRERVPPKIPYQRALLVFDQGKETLLIQTKFQQPPKTKSSLGWVVPVPCVPELATMRADRAERLFFWLNFTSGTRVTGILPPVVFPFLIGITLFSILFVLRLAIASVLNVLIPSARFSARGGALTLTCVVLLSAISAVLMQPPLGREGMGPDVQVLKSQKVGIYDVSVVASDTPDALINWLNANGFQFELADKETIEDYLRQGWCFVVAKVEPNPNAGSSAVVSEGLVAPLILRFNTDKPVYPLRLTACAGADTEVLIYVLTPGKMTCSDRLKLRFAGKTETSHILSDLAVGAEPQGFFTETKRLPSFLCRFKSTLSPAQMREDLGFAQADDNLPYRERIWKMIGQQTPHGLARARCKTWPLCNARIAWCGGARANMLVHPAQSPPRPNTD